MSVRVVVLTGAGVSAESGVPTFRDADGLWEGHRVEDVATPEAFDRDPTTVHRFYDARRAALDEVEPNAAHRALAELADVLGDELLLVTQNIDDLHERGGARDVLHMHGRLRSALCAACGTRTHWEGPMIDAGPCGACGSRALRPDVVWFGEVPLGMDRIQDALATCEVFCSIGTSGAVYPAAGFVQYAAAYGAERVELNLVPSEGTAWFSEARHGPASVLVPAWVAEVLGTRTA